MTDNEPFIRELIAEAAALWVEQHGVPGSYSLTEASFLVVAESVFWDVAGEPTGILPDLPGPKKKRQVPKAIRLAVFARDGSVCAICGAVDDLSIDHIHPESLGGSNDLENLRVLCRPCNSRKGVRTDGP